MIGVLVEIATESFLLFARMAPYLLLGIVVAGALHVLIPMGMVARHLGGRGLAPVFRAAVLGVPLPLCSCGVVPVAASLGKSGASRGAVVSFLVTTPTSGVDSILATYSLLGGAFAVVRTVASFLIGLVAGAVTALGLRTEPDADERAPDAPAPESSPWAGGRDTVRRGLVYAFGELLGGIARPLAVGVLIGGLISFLLPPGVLERYVGSGFASYLVMLAVATPLYVCASGSIPVAAALLAKGISPGAALVFLVAGPATNAASVTMVSEMLGRRALIIYLAILVLGSLVGGAATDVFFAGFPALLPDFVRGADHMGMHLSPLETVSAVILAIMVAYHLGMQIAPKLRIGRKENPMDNAFVLQIEDMNCQHCVNSVKRAVSGLPGVRGVDVDLDTRQVRFDLGENANSEVLVQAIADAGFHPELHQPEGV
jgi:uncharacterized membrane protein YraQ (UPF0718 family)/copper chaperone CopZ